ncbi:hypothetical protein FKP32DRAFT_1601524 [Trametes sanguinea]|nr:hypothetical protein FKP32DRAFT_1601524 [Trametes sanguinea]
MSAESICRFKASLPRPLKLKSRKAAKAKADASESGTSADDVGPTKQDNRQWASGHKFAYLLARIDAWKEACEVNAVSSFYDRITVAWLAMWGWDRAIEEDCPPLIAEPTDADIENVLSGFEQCSAVELLRRRRVFGDLRLRIQRWFRHHGKKSLKSQKTDPIAQVLADFTQTAFKPPRRLSAFHYYLSTHYDTDLKDIVDKGYDRVCAEAIQAGKDVPKKIALSNSVAARIYETKSDGFKKQMEEGAEKDYQDRLAHFHATAPKNEDPKTAEDYHRELEASQHWLSAFAEHVSRRLGMNVTIFLTGPVGEKGGEIGLRCINAGKSNTLVPMVWPDFDEGTFNAVSSSMIKFAHTCFTADQMCQALTSAAHEPYRVQP